MAENHGDVSCSWGDVRFPADYVSFTPGKCWYLSREGGQIMRVYFSHEGEFAERFQRSLGFWVRALSNVALVLLAIGVSLGVGALWDDYERLPVVLYSP